MNNRHTRITFGLLCVLAAYLCLSVSAFGRPSARVCADPIDQTVECDARVILDSQDVPASGFTPQGLSPAAFHGAYNLPAFSANPQKIAIVDAYDDPNIASDLAVYDNQFGTPCNAPCSFTKLNQKGFEHSYPRADPGWALEIALDVETAHQICQNCQIILVEAKTAKLADIADAVKTAVNAGATVISNSYGTAEFTGSDAAYNYPGVAITVSSGDSGYATSYPASSPHVTAVGGTTLTLGAGNTYGSERAWSRAGSGCSSFFAAQSWQTQLTTGCGASRAVSDVSADADPNTGAAIYDSVPYQGRSGWFQVGGTSLSAPLIAGVYGLAGDFSDNDVPAQMAYANPSALHDVTTGSNGTCAGSVICSAALGYDGPTGLGSPNGLGAF